MSKNKGYLLVDISMALTIFSILAFGIFTFYKTYKRIDNDNKNKLQCLNYVNYICSELKYNLDFNILEEGLDKEYTLDVKKISNINELRVKDNWLIKSVEKIINDNDKLNGYYISIGIVNENDNNSVNKNILNIEIKFMKNNGQYIYENIIKRYKYILWKREDIC